VPSLAFRLRVRNAADSADALVVTSVRTGTNPYISGVPQGDGQEVDILTGAVRTGAYVVEVADVVTGSDGTGTLRLVTQLLTDAGGRQQLLSRRTFVEVSEDGGATFPTAWMAGYLTNLRQVDAITYAFTVSDTRRVEQNHRAFTWGINPQDTAKSEQVLFPQRGCLLGGPIINGFGPTPDSGGIECVIVAEESAIFTAGGNRILAVQWLASSDIGPTYQRTRSFGEYATYANKVLAPFAVATTPMFYADPLFAPLTVSGPNVAQFWFPDLRVYLTDGVVTWVGTLRAFFPWSYSVSAGTLGGTTLPSGQWPYFYVILDASQPSIPSVPPVMRARVVHRDVSEASPLYFDLHPVDVVTRLYESVNIPYDTTAADAVRDAIGPDVRLACRITEPIKMADFLRESVFGPFGFSARTDGAGDQVLFLTRRLGTGTPPLTIGTDDLQGDDIPAGYDLDESTVCTAVRFTHRTLSKAVTSPDSNEVPPPDGIVEAEHSIVAESGDTSTFSTREVAYKIPGMVRHKDAWQSDMSALIAGVNQEIFDRFGRGAPTYDLPVLATSAAAAAQVGEEVLVDAAHVPNTNYRIGESTMGERVAQVVRRDETPLGPVFKLVDSGPLNQLATAPTITIAAPFLNARTLASFTITNAATINAIPAGVEVEYATGSSTPTTNGVLFTRYESGAVPTGAVLLPAFVPASRVWVRARSVGPEVRPSSWSSWANVTLDAWTPPSGLTVGTTSATAVRLSWTVGNPTDMVDVYLYEGGSAPSDWQPWRVVTLPPDSTTTSIRGLKASTNYQVAVGHRDPGTGASSALDTDSFTTTGSTSDVAPRVAYMEALPIVEDAQYPSGVALGLWAGNEALDIEIQRAPDSAGSPGTWATIATVPGSTAVFVDPLPSNGATFWYRSRHVGGGFTASAWQSDLGPYLASPWPWPIISAVVGNIPPNLTRPSRTTPSIQINVSYQGSNSVTAWSAVGQVEVWFAGAPLSPQPTSPWVEANTNTAFALYTFYVYAGGNLITSDVSVEV
jgi:hypothetical protein